MRAASQVPQQEPTEIDRTLEREAEQLFESVLTDIARKLWPDHTAAFLAAEAGCVQRAAEHYLAGTRKWSGDAIAAIVSEILRRHRLRNVRIVARR